MKIIRVQKFYVACLVRFEVGDTGYTTYFTVKCNIADVCGVTQ